MGRKILITGGVKSGKSHYSLELARTFSYPVLFLATADPNDESMKERIERHKKDRGREFETVEETIYIAQKIKDKEKVDTVMIIDCLTLWMNNLFQVLGKGSPEMLQQKKLFFQAVEETPLNLVMVTNEVGMGIYPMNQLARDFVDELGIFNQEVAQRCDEIIYMVAGYPQTVKRVRMDEF